MLTKRPKLTLQLQYNSPVILTFFLLSLGALFLGQWTGGWTTKHLFCVYRGSLKDPLFYIRLFGHVLGQQCADIASVLCWVVAAVTAISGIKYLWDNRSFINTAK